jgi:CRP-like cAMP-binding protein
MSASSDQLEVRRYQAGQVIIREGDESTEAFIVRAGTAEVVKRSAAGKDVVLATLDAGSIFGEMGLVQDRPRSATVRARTEVQVDVVDVHSFNALFASDAARRLRPLLQCRGCLRG